MSKNTEKQRVQLDFLPQAVERLDAIVNETGAASRAEVVRRALALYDRVLEAQKGGDEVIFKSKKGTEQKLIIV